MIPKNISYEDLESILSLCDSFQLVTLYLSMDQEILRANSMAERLFLRPKHELFNRSLLEMCQEFGYVSPILAPMPILAHWMSDNTVVDVYWTVSDVLNHEQHIGYLVIGKMIARHQVHQAPICMENILNNHYIGIFSKEIDGTYIVPMNDYLMNLYEVKDLSYGFESKRKKKCNSKFF